MRRSSSAIFWSVAPFRLRFPEEVESLRLALAASGSISGCVAAELDQTRLLRVQIQCKLSEPLLQIVEEAFRVCPMLEADDGVVRVAYNNHAAGRVAPAPCLDP